jgi:hypothetical protein
VPLEVVVVAGQPKAEAQLPVSVAPAELDHCLGQRLVDFLFLADMVCPVFCYRLTLLVGVGELFSMLAMQLLVQV